MDTMTAGPARILDTGKFSRVQVDYKETVMFFSTHENTLMGTSKIIFDPKFRFIM